MPARMITPRTSLLTKPILPDTKGTRPQKAAVIHGHEIRTGQQLQPFLFRLVSAILLFVFMFAAFAGAHAQDGVLEPGDAVVTGFSGIKPADADLPPGTNPLDEFFIDREGASAQVLSLRAPGGPPEGQLIAAPPKLQIKAGQVGQVFATALDDGAEGGTPNVYLGATSAYGLHIVLPDSDGDGYPERVRNGHPNAEWMPGQFGEDPEGGPGAIWRVDGKTGEVSLFATLPGNSGPGVGDVVFDRESRQFFASDLDSGLIYRIGEDGEIRDSFDHGVAGRPANGLAPVPDDGVTLDIKSPDFDVEKPESWGYTPEERRVYGLAVQQGRLFYAVAGQVWSIGVSPDGFGDDARLELDAEALPGDGPITDMLFDRQGRLYLAQRGAQRGSYDFSLFAEPEKSAVVRYIPETPDDPATEGHWRPDPEAYAIGLEPEHNNAEGGIALGYAHDESGALQTGACGETLWSTGHRLRPGELGPKEEDAGGGEEEDGPPEAAENDVHGLQGNAVSLVRPANTPPQQAYFADYDHYFGDAAKAGHVGDVEIWQPCEGQPGYTPETPDFGELPPGFLPPGDVPPELPPEFPPEDRFEANLRLTKWASPRRCLPRPLGWVCLYNVRVRNTGPDTYIGPVIVSDWLPAAPAGAVMGFANTPPWTCWATGPASHRCRRNVVLVPGASVGLRVAVFLPGNRRICHLRNLAEIDWASGGTRWNTNPADDLDGATALIPAEHCRPGRRTDLKIYKRRLGVCFKVPNGLRCAYRVTVENQGPGPYNGDIEVRDTIPAGTSAVVSGVGWVCGGAAPNLTCTFGGASLPNPGDSVSFTIRVNLSKDLAKQMNCRVLNRARIAKAPGGSPQNVNPANDQAQSVAHVPPRLCEEKEDVPPPVPAEDCPPGFVWNGQRCVRIGPDLPVPPPPPPVKECPPGTIGKYPHCRKIVDPKPECPEGTTGRYPNCRVVDPDPKCPKGTIGKYPHCRDIIVDPKPCTGGRIRVGRRCICPRRLQWNGERCVLRQCPKGTIGRFPHCRKIVRECPKGTAGRFPRCRKIVRECPKGTVGRFPRCRKIVRECPKGTVGRFPRCRKIIRECPKGTVGRFPRCRKIVRPCPPGTIGRFPYCRKVGPLRPQPLNRRRVR